MAKGKSIFKNITLVAVFVLFLCIYLGWRMVYSSNIMLKNSHSETFVYISSNPNLDSIEKQILRKADINDIRFFRLALKIKVAFSKIYPGKYRLENGLNNKGLIELLRPANRLQVKLVIKFFRTTNEIAEYVSSQLEARKDTIMYLLHDSTFLKPLGFNTYTSICLFIPNTYFFNWNTNAEDFLKRMNKEYLKFWTAERKAKADSLHLSKSQVITLASIVDRETNFDGEKARIAGVYLNRYNSGTPLQADPTIVFALGDFTIKRIRKGHLAVVSPYNTYTNIGLPPGPICTPNISSINAVLNAEKHKYLFFCAKEDFSGRHNFAVTFQEHLQNARKFQEAMNNNSIE